LDSKGNQFIARGINSANGDWDKSYPPWDVMPAIRSTGANCVRIQWLNDADIAKKGLGDNDLKTAIQKAIDNKMIPIVELWSNTGSNDYNALKDAGSWWVSKMYILKQFEDKLLINIQNEWSDWKKGRNDQAGHSLADFMWYIDAAVKPIRSSGWKGTLIIDSTAYAQSPNAILQYGQKMIDADPQHNLLFSLHLYADWREADKYDQTYSPYDKALLGQIVDKGLPLLIGEFSDKHPDTSCGVKYMNAPKIMKIARDKSIGYLGWSWKGNGKTCMELSTILDLSWNWKDSNYLTEWGKILVNDPNGIKATSKIASVFA